MNNMEQRIQLKNITKNKIKTWAFRDRYIYTKDEIILSRFFGEVASGLYQKGRLKELKGESDVQSFLTPPPTGTVFNCLHRREGSANARKRGVQSIFLFSSITAKCVNRDTELRTVKNKDGHFECASDQ